MGIDWTTNGKPRTRRQETTDGRINILIATGKTIKKRKSAKHIAASELTNQNIGTACTLVTPLPHQDVRGQIAPTISETSAHLSRCFMLNTAARSSRTMIISCKNNIQCRNPPRIKFLKFCVVISFASVHIAIRYWNPKAQHGYT